VADEVVRHLELICCHCLFDC